MEVVIEAEVVGVKGCVQGFFTGVAKGRVADVVDERQRFDQINIQAQRGGDGARNLRDFQRVGQAAAQMVRKSAGEDLGLAGETAERSSVQYAVAVALELVAIRMRKLRIAAAPCPLHGKPQKREGGQRQANCRW